MQFTRRIQFLFIACAGLFNSCSMGLIAQTATAPEYRILNDRQLFVYVSPSLTNVDLGCFLVEKTRPESESMFIDGRGVVTQPETGSAGWLALSFAPGTFSGNQVYLFEYKLLGQKAPESKGKILSEVLSTDPRASASKNLQAGGGYLLKSDIGFIYDASTADESDYSKNQSSCENSENDCNPRDIGKLLVRGAVREPKKKDAFKSLMPHNVFNQVVSIQFVASGKAATLPATVATSSSTASSSEADAEIYINVNAVAGTGASFAWGLDGKINWPKNPRQYGNFEITPFSATANGGHNTGSIKDQTYTDSVVWSLPMAWIFQHSFAGASNVVVLPKYETDFELNRENLLGAAYVPFQIRNHTQQIQIVKAGVSPPDMAAFVKDPKKGLYGYEFDCQIGVEGGAAIIDTSQKPSKGSAPAVAIPAYSIFRVVPVLHGLFQIWDFSFDSTFTGRYLALTENSATQSSADHVYPDKIQGWKGLYKLSNSFRPSPTGNFAVTATYTLGFDAPKFNRTNSVQFGIAFIH